MKILATLLFFLVCTTAFAQSPTIVDPLEKKVLSIIRTLPEVESFYKTSRNDKPTTIINDKPGAGLKYYWVRVGTSNFDQLRTNFNFLVNPKTFRVYYLDEFTESGTKIITLQQWRLWRTKPAWQKIHNYKNGRLVL